MNGTISINISGGQATFGAVVQNNAEAFGGVSPINFADLREQILREAVKQNESSNNQRILEEKLIELERLAQEKGTEAKTRAATLIDGLKDGFIWILPVLRQVTEIWFPSLRP